MFLPNIDLSLLSATGGFFDDYTYYDDFRKGYIDLDKWTYIEHTQRAEGRPCNANPSKTCYDLYNVEKENHDVSYIGLGGDDLSDDVFVVSGSEGFDGNYKGVSRFVYDYGNSFGNWESVSLIPQENLLGRHLKALLVADKANAGTSGSTASVSLVMNDIVTYTCENSESSYEGRDPAKPKECLVEAYQSFEHPEIYYITVNGQEQGSVNVSNPDGDGEVKVVFEPQPRATRNSRNDQHEVGLDYLKYKYPFGCKILKDETLVFDTFSSGSEINLSTLSHDPVRFCLDYPVKARNFEEAGIATDVRGEVLQDVSQGGSVSVPNNEEWKFFYITKWEPGIEQRCAIDEAYDTQKRECVNPNEQAIVGCTKDSECYIPDNCFGLTAQCVDWQCNYSGSCNPEPVTEKDETADECKSDSDCIPPCEGMTAYCKDVGSGKECHYSGSCQKEPLPCSSDDDCPQYARCANDVCVMTFNASDPDSGNVVTKPNRGFFVSVWTWFTGLFV